jgi:hypothetical protein
MSYGTPEAVAALAQTWTNNGEWIDPVAAVVDPPTPEVAGTNPTLTQVEKWLDEVSALMNLSLQAHGFDTPVTQVDAAGAIDMIVESVVADLCHAANSQGRFYTERILEHGISPMTIINKQINSWVEEFATGFEKLLVIRHTDKGVSTTFSFSPGRQD